MESNKQLMYRFTRHPYLLRMPLLFLISLWLSLPYCSCQIQGNRPGPEKYLDRDSLIEGFEIQYDKSPQYDATIVFVDIKNQRNVKRLTRQDIIKMNPFSQLPYEHRKTQSGKVIYDVQSLPDMEKKRLIKGLNVNPAIEEGEAADALPRFIVSYPTETALFDNKKFVGLTFVVNYYLEDPDEVEGIPIAGKTELLILNARGDIVAKWTEPYEASWIASNDAHFALLDVGFGGVEGEDATDVELKLIDLKTGKTLTPIDLLKQDSRYYLVQSYFKGTYFVRTYQNGEDKIMRLIVDPYKRKIFYKVYEFSASTYGTEKSKIAGLPDSGIAEEVRSYLTIEF